MEKNSESIKVTVIVPIYNVQEYVGQCINSIINQTYSNIEIILVDDGSQDSSGKICDEFADKDDRINVIHIKNSGVSCARNFGINSATGEYICFIDGDDYLSNDYVKYFLELILAFDADVAYSEAYYTSEYESQSKHMNQWCLTGEDAAIAQLCYKTNIGVWNKMFRRSLIGNSLRFIPEQYIGEGFNFNISAFQRAKSVAVGNKKVYYYRQNNSSSATKKFSDKKWINGLKSIDDIKSNMIIHSSKMEDAWRFARWRTNADIYIMMELSNVTSTYPKMYQSSKNIAKKEAICAFKVNITYKEIVSAILFLISPKLIFLKIKMKKVVMKLDEFIR